MITISKTKKRIILSVAIAAFTICIVLVGTISRTPVFMYHSVSPAQIVGDKDVRIKPEEFEKHMQIYSSKKYKYLFAKDSHELTWNKRQIVLTFDDGYVDNYDVVFPILKKYNAKATIFIVTDLINTPGYLTVQQLIEMQNSGYVDIQSHAVSHMPLDSFTNDESLEKELKNSQFQLEKWLNKPVTSIAYPNGKQNDKVVSIAKKYYKNGFLARSTWKFRLFNNPMLNHRLIVFNCTTPQNIQFNCERMHKTYAEVVCVTIFDKINSLIQNC